MINRVLEEQGQRQNRLVQRALNVFLGACVVGLLVQAARLQHFGPSPIILLQFSSLLLMTASLALRKYLPVVVVGSICFCVPIFMTLIGMREYGLFATGLTSVVVFPACAAIVWGARPGVAVYLASLIGVLGMVLAFGAGLFEPTVPATDFADNYANWLSRWFSFTAISGGALGIGVLYRHFWDSTVKALMAENEKRLKSEAGRDNAEAWWRSMARNISGVMFEYVRFPDGSHKILRMSEGSMDFWGLAPEAIENDINILFERVSHSARVEVEKKLVSSMETMSPLNIRLSTTSVSGEEKWLQMSGQPSEHDSGGTMWHFLLLDVSREMAAEQDAKHKAELLQQSERQKSIGQLTGGVAHDFNNLLAVTLGNLELLRDNKNDDQDIALIDNAINAVMRGSDLTKNMLAYSRQAPLEPKVLDLNELIRDSKNWFERTIPANIDIDTSFLANLWKIDADESSTVSAVLNLVVNARDAMPDGGKIMMETSNVRIEEDYIDERGEDIAPGRYVLLAISDTGVGLEPETLERIFEPFFTTKEPGSGTGLGLPMILGFMKQTGGTVRVYSEPGTGTTFKLYFPAYFGENVPVSIKGDTLKPSKSLGARILLVEDEVMLLENLETVLKKEGYQVETAKNGDEAALIFEADTRFDLVVTDIVMPGQLQGTTLSHKLREIRYDIPFVFMSGYAREAAVHGNGLRPEDIRLMKPIRRPELIKAIEQAIGSAKTP